MSMPSGYKPVPVDAAKSIAEQFEKSQVIVVSWDPVHGLIHTTTYGVSPADKLLAAKGGEFVNKALATHVPDADVSVHEDFRKEFDAADFKRATELLGDANSALQHEDDAVSSGVSRAIREFFEERAARKRGGE